MPARVPQDQLDSIIYLYPDIPSAERGEEIGGTGFLLGWPIGDGPRVTLWAVTNRHVIEQGHWTVRTNRKGGGFDFIDTDEREWIFHPDSDVAVRPIQLSHDVHRFNYFTKDWLLTREWFDALDIGPGDWCTILGRFVGHAGKNSNNPVARFGQISQNPLEPVTIDGESQECFLVEARSIGGSSGSPVIVTLDPVFSRPKLNNTIAPDGSTLGQGHWPARLWILGINFAMVPLWEPVFDSSGGETPSGLRARMNTGLMAAVPAWHIADLLEKGPAGDRRREIEAGVALELAQLLSLPQLVPTQTSGA